MKDCGYANGWRNDPEIVKECIAKGHRQESEVVGKCLTKYSCDKCGYFYKVDSGW